MTDQEFNAALAKLDAAIDTHHKAFKAGAVPSKDQICHIYHLVKPFLSIIIGILEKIPIWGAKVAAALKALMQLLDAFCGASA